MMKTSLFCLLIALLLNHSAGSANSAIAQWQSFAETSGNPNHAKWVAEISRPEAQSLAAEWKALRGYDAIDLIDSTKLPKQFKHGLTVKQVDVARYPWLKKYMSAEMYKALASPEGYIREITIVPTNNYYMHRGVLDATRNMLEKKIIPTTDEDSTLRNPDGTATLANNATASAIPYLHPKDGLELNWTFIAHGVGTETAVFNPLLTTVCTPEGEIDREYEAVLWWQKFHGRSQIGDEAEIPDKEGIVEGGAIYALSPFDVRGFAGVRQRYADGKKNDDFKIFLKTNQRSRTLSGTDAQDPMWAGLEVTWDDWRAYWVKTDLNKYEYKLIGEQLILASPEVGYVYDSAKISSSKCYWESMELELRPVWILEITDKTGQYQYKTRTTYIDKEFYYAQFQVTTDPRGEKYRTWEDSRAWRPSDGDMQWRHITIHNEYNNRSNFMFATPLWEDRDTEVTDEQFDVDQLRDYQ